MTKQAYIQSHEAQPYGVHYCSVQINEHWHSKNVVLLKPIELNSCKQTCMFKSSTYSWNIEKHSVYEHLSLIEQQNHDKDYKYPTLIGWVFNGIVWCLKAGNVENMYSIKIFKLMKKPWLIGAWILFCLGYKFHWVVSCYTTPKEHDLAWQARSCFWSHIVKLFSSKFKTVPSLCRLQFIYWLFSFKTVNVI